MLGQVNLRVIPNLNVEIECSKEEMVEIVEKVFRYGRHLGVTANTFNKSSLLVTKGESRNKTLSWMQVEIVNVEKMQKNRVERKLMFYCDKFINESTWFVSYFHKGDWVNELREIVNEFEEKCFTNNAS
jgi:hypothetical protein